MNADLGRFGGIDAFSTPFSSSGVQSLGSGWPGTSRVGSRGSGVLSGFLSSDMQMHFRALKVSAQGTGQCNPDSGQPSPTRSC